jgi:hypothetical protein
MQRSKLTEVEKKQREEKRRIRAENRKICEEKKLKREQRKMITKEIKWFLSHNDIKNYIEIGLGEVPSRYYTRNVANLADWMQFFG